MPEERKGVMELIKDEPDRWKACQVEAKRYLLAKGWSPTTNKLLGGVQKRARFLFMNGFGK